MQGEELRCLTTRGKLFDPAISVRAPWTSRRCVLMAVFQRLAYRWYPCVGCSSSGVQVGLLVPTLHHLVDYFGTAIIQVQIIIVSFLCVSSLSLVISLFYTSHTRSDVLLSLSFFCYLSLLAVFLCFFLPLSLIIPMLGWRAAWPVRVAVNTVQYSVCVCHGVCVCVCVCVSVCVCVWGGGGVAWYVRHHVTGHRRPGGCVQRWHVTLHQLA